VSGTELSVRPVEASEYEAVGRLTVDVYAAILGDQLGPAYAEELLQVAHRAEHAVVLVAVQPDGGIVGSVTYVPGPGGPYAEFPDGNEAGIRMLAVWPYGQRQGVGTALVEACLALARRDGRERVSLHTTPAMVAAQRFYQRLGFRRAPERDWEPRPGLLLLGYVLELDAVPAPGA
jgi:ribosomal protein S18 acetylase RimI-like enzyme